MVKQLVKDGKGRKYLESIAEFGECVIYCKLGSKDDERLAEGIWLGSKDESDESLWQRAKE